MSMINRDRVPLEQFLIECRKTKTNRDYFMVSERVRFLFTSCEGWQNEQASVASEWVCYSSQRVKKIVQAN